jgi:hypothetical protein
VAKRLDLVGQTFNRWTVLERVDDYVSPHGKHRTMFLCKCECGKTKEVGGSTLISGESKSCGCYSIERAQEQLIDLTGQRFGRLTVIELHEKRKKKNGSEIFWLCRCDCGNETVVQSGNFKNNHTTSCGCFLDEQRGTGNFIDLTGTTFGCLTVIERYKENYVSNGKQYSPKWLCICQCGNETVVIGQDLRNGCTKSCGCLKESLVAFELKRYCFENYGGIPEYDECVNPETNRYLPYDIYIPNNVYIEVHGPQHYDLRLGYFYKSEDDFLYRQHLDQLKKEYAQSHGLYIEVDLRTIKTTEQAIAYVEGFLQ